MAVAVIHSISCGLPGKFQSLSLSSTPTAASAAFRPLSFSSTTSLSLFSKGLVLVSPVQMPLRRSIVCEAAPKKKADSAAKRARQAEKRRVYNKARKSEIRTRMKKVHMLMAVTDGLNFMSAPTSYSFFDAIECQFKLAEH